MPCRRRPTASASAPARSACARTTTCRAMAKRFAPRIGFAHLRATKREGRRPVVLRVRPSRRRRRHDRGAEGAACREPQAFVAATRSCSGPTMAIACSTTSRKPSGPIPAIPRSAGCAASPNCAAPSAPSNTPANSALAQQGHDARRAAGYLSAVEYAAPRSRPRNLPRRIDHRSRLFCITSASAGRAFNCFSGTHAMIAFRSWTPCSSMIHVPSRSPASRAAMRSATGSMSFATSTFMTMRPPGCQPRADGIAGLDVEFIVKAKIRTSDIDGDPVVKQIVIENEFPEIGHDQRQSVRQPKISLSDHEADRIVVDDRQLFSETRQSGGEISAAASQDENVRRAMQKFVHELDIAEDALAVGRGLTLPDAFLEIDPRSIRGAFDDLDCAVPALIASQQPHLSSPCIK